MGLLDGLNDPISMGLLGAGAALLQPRRVGFGDAINAFQGSAVETQNRVALQKRNEQQTQLLMMQLAQMKEAQEREKQRRTMAQQFNQTGAQQAASLPGGPTEANAAKIPQMPGGFDANGYMQALLGQGDLEGAGQAARFTPKAPEDFTLSEGQTRHGADGKVKASGAQRQSDFERMISAIYPPGSPEYVRIMRDKITKDSTHQPPVQVSYGAPVAGVDGKGNPVFFQPSKDGKTPPTLVPDFKPAPQNRDTKLPAELQRMQIAGDAMESLLGDYENMLRKHSPRDPMVQANPAVRADMQALKRNIELQLKELQALGALAGPDVQIIRESLTDPFSFTGALYGKDGLLSQAQRSRQLIKVRREAVSKSQGKQPDAPAAPQQNDDPLGLRK
jgi:hypothetical protein